MKSLVYGGFLVIYHNDKDRFSKCNKIDRGDTQGFYYATDYIKDLERQLVEARELALKYKIKYNNQSSDMLRHRQSKKDQTELIRKLKEKGDE